MEIGTKVAASPPSPSPRPASADGRGEAGRVATAPARAAPSSRTPVDAQAKFPPARETGVKSDFSSVANHRLELRVDEDTGEVFARVINGDTGRAIDEIPAKELRHLAAQIKELLGQLLDRTA